MRLRGGILALALLAVACAAPTQPGEGPSTTISGSGEGRTGGKDNKPKADASPVTLAEAARIQVLGPAAGILSSNGARVVSNQGGQVVSNQGGNLISDKGTGLTSKTKYSLAQVNPLFAPAAKAAVVVTDLAGRPLSGTYVAADDQGVAKLTKLAPADVVIVYASSRIEGFDVLLTAIVPAPKAGEALEVDPATAMVTKRLQALAANGSVVLDRIPPTLPRALARAIASKMTAEMVAGAAVLDAQGAAQAFDDAVKADPTLATAIKAVPGVEGDFGTALLEPVPRKATPSPSPSAASSDPGLVPVATDPPLASPSASPTAAPTPTPQVLAYSPASAKAGQTLTIDVKDLAGTPTVTIGGKAANVLTTTATKLQVTVPPDAQEGTVVVTASGIALPFATKLDVVEEAGVYDAGTQPGAMAVDISGGVWVANGDGKVTRLTPAGTVLATYDVEAGPRRLAAAADGGMWVSCASGNVVKLGPTGDKVAAYDAGADPWGLAVDEAGDVWVANRSAKTITQIGGTTGEKKRTTTVTVDQPEDLAWDAAGDLWVSHAEGLNVTRGQVSAVTGTKGATWSPGGALVGPDGKIFLSYRGADKVGRLQDLTSPVWSVGVADEPLALGLDQGGDLWVACGAGGQVLRLAAADGKVRGTFPYAGASGLVVDPSGSVWVSRSAAGKVVKLLP